ncbi:MAG: AraC family transcriptional regulator [Verrucomicrobia bacterium]|nr:AraC family transcriptional regulator [Verrucomicrobiota bacterium]
MKVDFSPANKSSQGPQRVLPEERAWFFSQMQPDLFTALFSALEGVIFFIKDKAGRFITITRGSGVYEVAPANHELASCEGVTDHDLYPKSIADRIRADDRRVMETRQPLLNVVELLVNPRRCAVGWHVTNKFPVVDAAGLVLGVMGTVQPCEGRFQKLLRGTRLDAVVELVCARPAIEHSVQDLARLAGMSPRNMARHFQRVLGMAPREFMMLCRIKSACERLLQPRQSVAFIAQECGFCDQSAFAYQFRRSVGMAPMEYRKRYSDAVAAQQRNL